MFVARAQVAMHLFGLALLQAEILVPSFFLQAHLFKACLAVLVFPRAHQEAVVAWTFHLE
jgi:hypothetical protein